MAQPKVKVRFELDGEGEARAGIRRTRDEATEAADRIDKRFKALGDTLKAIGIGTLIGSALGFAIRQTIEAERTTAALDARLKSLGTSASASKERIQQLAELLQSRTTFAGGAITEAATSLLAFVNIDPSKFDKALSATLDVSTAKMLDLASAADVVGKALNDPAHASRELRQLGIELTKSQEDLVKSLLDVGDRAGAQQVILDELAARYDGAAVAARDTFGGAIEALKVTLGNLVEGGPGTLTGARAAVEDLNQALNDPAFKDAADTIVAGLFDIIKYAGQAAIGLSSVIDTWKEVDERSTTNLLARKTELEDLIAASKQGLGQELYARLNVSSGAFDSLKELEAELNRIDAIITKRTNDSNRAPPTPSGPRFLSDDTITIRGGDEFGSGRAADAAARREAERRKREAERAAREQQRAAEDYRKSLEDLRAELDGPLAQAQLQYERRLAELNELAAKGKVSAQDQAEAQKLLREEYDKNVAAIQRQLDPAAQLLDDMRFELSLLGLTNAQRRTAIQLRQLDGKASAEQAAQIAQLNQAYEDQQKGIDAMDNVRQASDEAFKSIITGSESALDAVKNFFDAVAAQIAQLIAQQLTNGLFGQPGQQGGGLLGGVLGSIFGGFGGGGGGGGGSGWGGLLSSLFGGSSTPYYGSDGGAAMFGFHALGFAKGGNPPVGSPYWVGENGPELRIDRQPSTIVPMDKLSMGGDQNFYITVPRDTNRRSANQTADATGRAVARANARSGR